MIRNILLALAATLAVAPAVADFEDLEGQWWGTIRHAGKPTAFGLGFERKPDDRVLVRMWLPELNAYGAPVAWAERKDGAIIASENLKMRLSDGVLRGDYQPPSMRFELRRVDRPLPAEPTPPRVPTGPEPAWTYRAGASLWASPIVHGDTVYAGDDAGVLHAVDVHTGAARWQHKAGAAIYGAVDVAADGVYLASDDGVLVKLASDDGAVLWQADIGGANVRSLPSETGGEWDFGSAAPVARGGVVYMGSADGTLRTFNAANGKAGWTFKARDRIRAAPLVDGDLVYVGSMDHFVYALDRKSGAQKWRFDTGSAVTTSPVFADGHIVVGTRDMAQLTAVDPGSGRRRWSDFWWLSWIESTPAVADGVLYIGGSDSRRIRSIRAKDGRYRWDTQVWGWTWGTPLVTDDLVFYATAGTANYMTRHEASLGALDRKSGQIKWRKPIPLRAGAYFSGVAGSLALAGDRFVAANLDGTLAAYPRK
jgi:outer membrane protein assembly factor BamB